MSNQATDVNLFLGECNAGMLIEKVSAALSDAALAQLYHAKKNVKGKVALTFTFQQIGDNEQVTVTHAIETKIPTKRGFRAEQDITETAFHVGKGGALSINAPRIDDRDQFNMQCLDNPTLPKRIS